MIPGADFWRTSRTWILLFCLVVVVPAALLVLGTVRAFRGEEARQQYQRRERQQQIVRLLDAELTRWLFSLGGGSGFEDLRLRFEGEQLVLPEINVAIAPQAVRRPPAFADSDLRLWREAQLLESSKSGSGAEVRSAYAKLAERRSSIAGLARLALLRLALRADDTTESERRFAGIEARDGEAFTESGIPVWVGTALLISGSTGSCRARGAQFVGAVLDGLVAGRWRLDSGQWLVYASDLIASLKSCGGAPPAVEHAERLSSKLRSVTEAAPKILALRRVGARARGPVQASYVSELGAFLVLFPGTTPENACLVGESRFRQRAAERLQELVAVEDFGASLAQATGSGEFPLPSFPEFQVSFQAQQSAGILGFGRHYFFYSTLVLLALTLAGLVFSYRAVAREVEVARLKSDFVAAVSHEFRSPLTSILALLERLQSGRVRDEETSRRYHGVIRQEVERLSALVSNLLDFSRLQKGKHEFNREPSDLVELIDATVESFRNLGHGDRVRVDALEPSAMVSIDRGAVGRCIQNLIDNALKYSPKDAPVMVRSGRDNGSFFIEVADRGPGIPVSEQRKIFEEFYRARTTDAHNVKGAGLGLALVKRIMEGHGGEVTVRSQLGAGSAFRLVFPVPGQEPLG
jgi:signal transduction histidine kinase